MMTKSLLTACTFALLSFSAAHAAKSEATAATAPASVTMTTDTNDKIGPSIDLYDKVLAGYTDTWTYTFRANSEARVTVEGDGDTDLDLYIYDENNNLITKDDDNIDYCICTWTPKWTGTFKIKIVNRGSVYNRYHLMIP
ncbi:MAG: hypothetical protein MR624_07125 [Bacteroidales bacterium]|nr:hypothetical protein [Bacteroidales bacterium]MCI6252776.1 hypothetical protein [Bacteroidales bacterium]